MKVAFLIWYFIFFVTGQDNRQQNVISKTLVSSSQKMLDVPAFSFYGHGQCDQGGHLFFQIDTDHSINSGSVVEINPSTGEPTLFKMPATLPPRSYFINFSVSPSGHVWMLIGNGDKVDVLGFNSEGEVSSQATLAIPEHLKAQEFAVTDQGHLLLSGFFDSRASAEMRSKPYSALFSNSGQILKQLIEPNPNNVVAETGTRPYEGNAIFGDDKNLYSLHADGVVVMSQAGTILRRLPIKKPAPEYSATNLVVSGGYLSIWLQKTRDNGAIAYKFLILDVNTGEPLAVYEPGNELGNTPVCFSRKDGFTFYRVRDGRVNLEFAALR
jgi:hypothetical protein